MRHNNEAKIYRCTGCSTSSLAFHSELEFANHVKTLHTNNSPLLTAFATHHVNFLIMILKKHNQMITLFETYHQLIKYRRLDIEYSDAEMLYMPHEFSYRIGNAITFSHSW